MAFTSLSAPGAKLAAPSHRAPSRSVVVCQAQRDPWRAVQGAGAGLLLSAALLAAGPAHADLNKFEQEAVGEFGMGTAQQYGEADIKGRDFSGQDLRRSNFTSADCRGERRRPSARGPAPAPAPSVFRAHSNNVQPPLPADCNFKGSKLVGAYFIKAVVPRANFEGADLSDTLMDRAVINGANLRNAVLQRAIFTRSDFGGADIFGADFTNALVDRTQQLAMCKIADGVNATTGVSTRDSLGCGSRRAYRASTPSNPEGPRVDEAEKAAFRKSMPAYRE
jgi:uncharacterized protein YjbI with pentapeptide repeats